MSTPRRKRTSAVPPETLPPISTEPNVQQKPGSSSYKQQATASPQSLQIEQKGVSPSSSISPPPPSPLVSVNIKVPVPPPGQSKAPNPQLHRQIISANGELSAQPPPPPPPPPPPHSQLTKLLQPVPKPHNTSKESESSSGSSSSKKSELAELHSRMTADHVRHWALTDDNFESGITDVKFAINTLKAVQPILVESSQSFTPLFEQVFILSYFS